MHKRDPKFTPWLGKKITYLKEDIDWKFFGVIAAGVFAMLFVFFMVFIALSNPAVTTKSTPKPTPESVPSTTWPQTLPPIVYQNTWLTIYCDGSTALYKWNGESVGIVPSSTKCAPK